MHWKKPGALIVLACAVVTLALMLPGVATARKSTADTVLTHGFVYTVEKHGCSSNVKTAQAVAILNGKIIFVGTDCAAKKYIGPHTKVVDVHGKMVMPGLEDGHFHGQGFVACDMGYAGGTEDQILQKIHDALLREDQLPLLKTNDVLECEFFLSNAMLPAGTVLTRDMLDRLSLDSSQDQFGTGTTRPIVVHEADFHKSFANSTAIDNAGVDATTEAPLGSFIGHYGADAPAPFHPGDPNGAFSDYYPTQPFGDSAPQPANANYLGKLSDLQKLSQAGVTSGWQALGFASDLPVWKQLADDGKLTVRINQSMFTPWVQGATDRSFLQSQIDLINAARAQYSGYSSPNSPGTLTVDTAKIFADGVAEFPAQTAAMLEPYNINTGSADSPVWEPGILRGPDPTVDDATLGFKMLDANHWSIHVHAIGNRAVRATLDNYAAIQKANRRWDRRDVVVHIEFVDPADMPRFGKLGVVADFQLQWAGRDVYTVDGVQGYINQDVLNTSYPAHSLLKDGAVLAQGSDWPVDPYEPFNAIMVAVTRENIANPARGKYAGTNIYSEHITLPQALRMGTMGTAYQLHQDEVTGSIKVGKYADLIVLDQNLFKIPAMQISSTRVLLTMIGGKVVWQDPVNPL